MTGFTVSLYVREQRQQAWGSHGEACKQMESLFAKKKSVRATGKAWQDPVRLRGIGIGVWDAGEPALKTVQMVMLAPSHSQQSTEAADCGEVAGE